MRALRARGGVVIGTLAACALLLSGCVAGKDAPTSKESPSIDGTNASIGNLLLRDVSIAAPANGPSYAQGSSATLQLVIVNNGRTPDTLTGISTNAADGIAQSSGASSDTTSPGASSSDSSSASSSASASSSSSAQSAGAPFAPIDLQPNSAKSFGLGSGGTALVLNSLKSQLFSAAVVPITFTFQSAGSVTVEVPVQLTAASNPSGQVVTAGMTAESSATE